MNIFNIIILLLTIGTTQLKIFHGVPSSNPSVVLIKWNIGNTRYFCSGAVIGNRKVLTAGHCIVPNVTYTISNNFVKGIAYKSSRARGFVSAEHSFDGSHNDVGIITTASNIFKHIPKLTINFLKPKKSQVIKIFGYGKTEHGQTEVLNTSLMKLNTVNKYNIIAYGLPGYVCFGDSGGPVLLHNKIRGIISFTYYDCQNRSGFASLYNNTVKHFIKRNLE